MLELDYTDAVLNNLEYNPAILLPPVVVIKYKTIIDIYHYCRNGDTIIIPTFGSNMTAVATLCDFDRPIVSTHEVVVCALAKPIE